MISQQAAASALPQRLPTTCQQQKKVPLRLLRRRQWQMGAPAGWVHHHHSLIWG
jgi:hypothetical protein